VLLVARTELIAADVYTHAADEPITMTLVRARLDELATHPGHCCCGLCHAARTVTAAAVYRTANTWAWQVRMTRARALR
jgi:hypothetical protein